MSLSTPFHEQFLGVHPFYSSNDYQQNVKEELKSKKALPAINKNPLIKKIGRIAYRIFSIIVFPLGLYDLVHWLGSKTIVKASHPATLGLPKNQADLLREQINLKKKWKTKRFSLFVKGKKVDICLIGRKKTLKKDSRWLIDCNGNTSFYESRLLQFNEGSKSKDFKTLLKKTNSNAILFNYPGVGASEGAALKKSLERSYHKILKFVESEKGLKAKEIISLHTSLGGGVKAACIKKHVLKPHIKYCFVENQTFNNLSDTIDVMSNKILGGASRVFGWNMDAHGASKKLKAPEIILQTANVSAYQEIFDDTLLKEDGLFKIRNSLAKALFNDKDKTARKNKRFIGIPDIHGAPFSEPDFLANLINDSFSH